MKPTSGASAHQTGTLPRLLAMNYWNNLLSLCPHLFSMFSKDFMQMMKQRTLNKTRNKDFYTTFLFSLLHVANLMNMKPSSCSSECFGLWVSANCFYFLNESRGFRFQIHKDNSSASFHHPALYSLLAPLTAAEPQQKLRMAVWDKQLLWSFMFLLAGKTEVLFWSCFSDDQWKQGSEFSFDSLAAAALHPNPV